MHDALGKVSAIIAPSQFVGNLYHTWGVAAGIDVIPHGIDTIRTIPGKKVTPAGIHFGYIGTISEFKGVDILIKAFMNVTGDEASLSVYGDFQSATQYYRSLKKISRNDKRIHFHGAYDTKQLGDILSTIDVVVVPTRCNESFNMVIREAFSQKIPVIASRIGAIPEIVKDNINGMMFEPGNIVQLSQKMQALLERPAQVRQFARNAPPIKYIADHAREIENVYNRLLNSFNR
jgi:glycosyltransferase involved in cell wall biosynthesis